MENFYIQPGIEKETVNGIREISLFTNAFTNRKIFIFGDIEAKTVYSFTAQMLYLMEESTNPIDIYINSPGGEVDAGLAIYDIIQSCESPINMYCVGIAASMGALLFASGQKGRRFILPHSRVMIHEPLITGGLGGSASTIKSTADSIIQTRNLINGILSKHTGKNIAEINKATDHDNYMSATKAIEFGLCDRIVEKLN